MFFKINTAFKLVCDKLTMERFNEFKNKRKSNYECSNSMATHRIGSYGEVGCSKILTKFDITHENTFFDICNFRNIADIKTKNYYLEIKSRTKKDWDIYKQQMPLKQFNKYKKNMYKNKIIIVWMSVLKKKILMEGWNYISDFDTNPFRSGKFFYVKPTISRSPKDLIKLLKFQKYRIEIKK